MKKLKEQFIYFNYDSKKDFIDINKFKDNKLFKDTIEVLIAIVISIIIGVSVACIFELIMWF